MPLPRGVGLVRAEDVLADAAELRPDRRLPQAEIRALGADLDEGAQAAAATRQGEAEGAGPEGGPGAHPQVAQLLSRGPETGHPGHQRPPVQQDLERARELQPALLRPRLQHPDLPQGRALPVSLPLVLLRHLLE